jgi:calcineurin-like phosphoesterase family protein
MLPERTKEKKTKSKRKHKRKKTMIHGHHHIRGCEPTTLESTAYKQETPVMEAPEKKKKRHRSQKLKE